MTTSGDYTWGAWGFHMTKPWLGFKGKGQEYISLVLWFAGSSNIIFSKTTHFLFIDLPRVLEHMTTELPNCTLMDRIV